MPDDKIIHLKSGMPTDTIASGLDERMIRVLEETAAQIRTGTIDGFVLCVLDKNARYAICQEGHMRLMTNIGLLNCAIDDLMQARKKGE